MEDTGMLSGAPAARQDGRKLWQYLSAVSACFLAISVGTALAWTSPVLPKLKAPDSWLPLTDEQASWVSSLTAIGALIGALPASPIADSLGRKRALLLLALPFLVSWILILLAKLLYASVWMLYVARAIVGVGVGASCVLVPTYLSEIGEPSIKGTLGASFQLFLTIGIVYTFVLGAYVDYATLAVVCAVIEIVFVGSFLFIPESPVWLMGKGRRADATSALKRLRGSYYDVSVELNQIQKEADENDGQSSSVFDLVRLPAPRKALLICFAGMAFQQLSGVNAVIFYTVDIFKAAGSSLDPDIAAILVSVVQCIMSVVAAAIVDKAGRKPLLMFSSSVMSCSLIALGLFFKLQENHHDVSKLGWLPLASLILFMVAFSIGMGPIPWMLMGELFTVELKGNASTLAVMLNWFLVFLVTKTFPALIEVFRSSGTFWIFAVVMALATIFTWLVVPETKGKSIQEMQDELLGNRSSGSS